MMKKIFNFQFSIFNLLLLSLMVMTSCSETDDTVEEYADWQNVNETFFKALYDNTQLKIASGDTSWRIIRGFNMPSDHVDAPYKEKAEDCIVVHVKKVGEGTVSPIYTDKATVHYQGHLLPSATYSLGYVFDKSFYGSFNEDTATPSTFDVSGVVDGFSTALQNMHKGDEWEVYIPYQLGYGKKASNSIPGYSTLVFDITLVDFEHPNAK